MPDHIRNPGNGALVRIAGDLTLRQVLDYVRPAIAEFRRTDAVALDLLGWSPASRLAVVRIRVSSSEAMTGGHAETVDLALIGFDASGAAVRRPLNGCPALRSIAANMTPESLVAVALDWLDGPAGSAYVPAA